MIHIYSDKNNMTSKCSQLHAGRESSLSTEIQLLITTITCSLGSLLFGMLLGALIYYCVAVQHVCKPDPPVQVIYDEVPPNLNVERQSDVELESNVAYGHSSNTPDHD